MNMLYAPVNTVFVTLTQKFYDAITFESGVTLYKDISFHPEEAAMLEATVVSVPRAIIRREDYAGMATAMQAGDKVLMRYDVVYAYIDQPDRSTPVYKNLVMYEGEEYWKADIQKIFAVVRDGQFKMVNGYVMCDSVEERLADGTLIIRPEYCAMVQRKDKMKIRKIGEPLQGQPNLHLQPGDTVLCSPQVAQQYSIGTDTFYIIKQSHILACNLYEK